MCNTFAEQLANRGVQLEHVRSQRYTQFAQDDKFLAHMRLFSSEALDWKSRLVSEAEQTLVRESAEAARKTTEIQDAMNKQYKARWKQAEAQIMVMQKSNN